MPAALWQQPGALRGAGIGLRSPHVGRLLAEHPDLPWLEALTDNHLLEGGPQLAQLDAVRSHYPLALHGVGLSLGSTDPLNRDYLAKLKQLAQRVQARHISEHLCWTSVDGEYLHELMPLPYTDEAVKHIANRIRQVQDFLGQRILVENVSSYMSYDYSAYTEWEFVQAVVEEADCLLLLDINNVYVSACNHGFDAQFYLSTMPADRIAEIHLGGFEQQPGYLLDTHGTAVSEEVWHLYRQTVARIGPRPTLIEWDNNIPELEVLLAHAQRAQQILDRVSLPA